MVTALTFYMPLLIFVNGNVSIGHILVGYLGVMLIASASLSIGLFASSLAGHQVVAILIAVSMLGTLFLIHRVAMASDPPLNTFLAALAIYHAHQRAFTAGLLKMDNVIFNLAVTFTFLLATTKTLEARRWR